MIDNPHDYPNPASIEVAEEPYVNVSIITPQEFANDFDLVVAEVDRRSTVRYFRQDQKGTYLLKSRAEETEPCPSVVTVLARVISVYHKI